MRQPADWIAPDWPAPRTVHCLITTRAGGVSTGPCASMNLGTRVGDDPVAVERNRALLRALLPEEPFWLRQVHGTRVVQAQGSVELEADASFTTVPRNVCAVLVADCLPVLLCDRAGSVVAAAHAGWRGLSAGVIENTVAALPSPPAELIAYLGPAIGPEAFEVGRDVLEAFLAVDARASHAFRPKAPGPHGEPKWLADLYALARQRLARAGVGAVYGGGLCTYRDSARFFSHRRDPRSGRQAALVWLGHASTP
jgi:YfiH family protein